MLGSQTILLVNILANSLTKVAKIACVEQMAAGCLGSRTDTPTSHSSGMHRSNNNKRV